jgi:hypothetical protein
MKFSIRDVLWLTVVVALAVGWGLDRLSLRRGELRARQEADRARYHAEMARAMEAMRAAEMARAVEVLNSVP